jgi:hypothetical protein
MTATVDEEAVTGRQLELLRRLGGLPSPPCVMGGFAEDALLAGTVTRPHVDVDLLFPRHELGLRLDQLRRLGFTEVETWGEAAAGEPFYLSARTNDLELEIAITDAANGRHAVRVQRLFFELDGKPAPAGYQLILPDDTYEWPPATIEGIAIRVASPLALYQLRAGIASQGSFGELSDRHREASRRLRDELLGDRSESELAPLIERLI